VCVCVILTACATGEAAVVIQTSHRLTRLTGSIHSLAALHTAACERPRTHTFNFTLYSMSSMYDITV